MTFHTIEKSKYPEHLKRLREDIEKRHGKTVDQLSEERAKRINDAIELRVPDRVPVTIHTGPFAARYAGLPLSAMYYDHAARSSRRTRVCDLSS